MFTLKNTMVAANFALRKYAFQGVAAIQTHASGPPALARARRCASRASGSARRDLGRTDGRL